MTCCRMPKPNHRLKACATSSTDIHAVKSFSATFRALCLLEDVEDFLRNIVLRLIPADFEVFLPVLGPRPSIEIDEAGVGAGQLRRTSIGVLDIAQALDVRITAIRIVR